jgi:hypothetical protein
MTQGIDPPRGVDGRFEKYKLDGRTMDPALAAGSWEFPPDFATADDLIRWFLPREAPDWAARQAHAWFNTHRADVVEKTAQSWGKIRFQKAVDQRIAKNKTTMSPRKFQKTGGIEQWERDDLWSKILPQARADAEADTPQEMDRLTARHYAKLACMMQYSWEQFKAGEEHNKVRDLPFSTPEGETTLSDFAFKWGYATMPTRCYRIPDTEVRDKAEDAAQTAQRALDAALQAQQQAQAAAQAAARAAGNAAWAQQDADSARRGLGGAIIGASLLGR